MKILIVGAGLYGSVLGRALAERGHRVHIIDRRDHIAGNCFDRVNRHGIRVHTYGPHIFHTANQRVIDYVTRHSDWIAYRHRVRARLSDGRLVPLPVNRETLRAVPRDQVVDVLFRPYSRKMWGMDLDGLDPSIAARVPVDDDAPDDYFAKDHFVGFPTDGYSALVAEILRHPRVSIDLETPFEHGVEAGYDLCFNSMSIDAFFDFRLGRLPYRSIRFHEVHLPESRVFPFPVVNFTDGGPITRVTEWKNFPGHGAGADGTTVTFEEPCAADENDFERYYPIKDRAGANRALYRRYLQLVPAGMTFIGRTGLYTYLDMDQAISSALALAAKVTH